MQGCIPWKICFVNMTSLSCYVTPDLKSCMGLHYYFPYRVSWCTCTDPTGLTLIIHTMIWYCCIFCDAYSFLYCISSDRYSVIVYLPWYVDCLFLRFWLDIHCSCWFMFWPDSITLVVDDIALVLWYQSIILSCFAISGFVIRILSIT